jgi:hypothetical protein
VVGGGGEDEVVDEGEMEGLQLSLARALSLSRSLAFALALALAPTQSLFFLWYIYLHILHARVCCVSAPFAVARCLPHALHSLARARANSPSLPPSHSLYLCH